MDKVDERYPVKVRMVEEKFGDGKQENSEVDKNPTKNANGRFFVKRTERPVFSSKILEDLKKVQKPEKPEEPKEKIN